MLWFFIVLQFIFIVMLAFSIRTLRERIKYVEQFASANHDCITELYGKAAGGN